MKKIVFSSMLAVALFGNVSDFAYLNKPADVSEYKSLEPSQAPKSQMLQDLINNPAPNDKFLTPKEQRQIGLGLQDALQEISGPKDYILFFMSATVPRATTAHVLRDVSILQENGFKVASKQYVFGIPDDMKNYMVEWEKYLKSLPGKVSNYVIPNFGLKIDPRFFKVYEIKKVPAIAYATCAGDIPDVSTCKIAYLIHGDVSLTTFFEQIVRNAKDRDTTLFKEYIKVLDANKIYESDLVAKPQSEKGVLK